MLTRLLALALLSSAATALPTLPAEAAAPQCDGQRATIVGTPRNDSLAGTPRRDVIVGRGGDDLIHGLGGNDVLCGGDGADVLVGGSGDDRLFAGRSRLVRAPVDYHARDRLVGGSGDDHFDIGAEASESLWDVTGMVDFSAAPRGIELDLQAGTATGWGNDTIAPQRGLRVEGSEHDDLLRGSVRWEVIFARGGDDVVEGRGGDDLLEGEDEGARLRGPSDYDVMDGGAGDDYVMSRRGPALLRGGPGDDAVTALGREPSKVFGDQGNDSLQTTVATAPGYVLDGGAGYDDGDLTAAGSHEVSGILVVRMGPGTIERDDIVTGSLAGIEDLQFGETLAVDYYGTDAAERVNADHARRLRAWTYGGDDDVLGSQQDDFVDAGEGTDNVSMGQGHDTCLDAESRLSCEVLTP
jgi:hypothetical protein